MHVPRKEEQTSSQLTCVLQCEDTQRNLIGELTKLAKSASIKKSQIQKESRSTAVFISYFLDGICSSPHHRIIFLANDVVVHPVFCHELNSCCCFPIISATSTSLAPTSTRCSSFLQGKAASLLTSRSPPLIPVICNDNDTDHM